MILKKNFCVLHYSSNHGLQLYLIAVIQVINIIVMKVEQKSCTVGKPGSEIFDFQNIQLALIESLVEVRLLKI